ncbi:hypothetical protein Ais01nite_74370 [Asanoa ishikariensis]|nr:hypothetical protein Ais01nite_74370 [Asanoa ishikariensis]
MAGGLTDDEAIAQARRTGKAVEVTGRTSPTDRVVANANGSLTQTRHAVPVRKRVNGTWKDLDATLRMNTDGAVAPFATSSDLILSGGGAGPLATMRTAGRSLAFALPVTLPKPVLSGSTATYEGVLPGVDLWVAADRQGGFSHVLIVHSAAAAAHPAVRTLTLTTSGNGMKVSADAAANLVAKDSLGHAVFAASAPVTWDSKVASSRDPVADEAGNPQPSSAAGPGRAAKKAPVAVKLTSNSIALAPPTSMLAGPDTVYPLYIDSSWTPVMPTAGAARGGYASVAEQLPSSNKWMGTADPNPDNMQVGDSGTWRGRTMINFGIDTTKLTGAAITEAHIDLTDVYSYSCTPSKTRVFAPSTTLSRTNATWDYWSGVALGGEISNRAAFAYGYSSACPARAVAFPVLASVKAAVAAGKKTQTFVFTGDTNETTDRNSYKEFSIASAAMTITYNHTPTPPTNLTTSPATPCTGTVGAVGDGNVMLYAPVSDPDGGTLGVRYNVWRSDTPGNLIASSDPASFSLGSGGTAVLVVGQPILKAQARGAVTEFSWKVQVWDGFATSGWSDTCKFNFDPNRSGAPGVTPPADGTTHIGEPVTIAVSKPMGSSSLPARYLYQLNAGPHASVPADSSGNGSITITPTRRTNTLTVSSVSAGGNIGVDAATVTFTTAPFATFAADADLTGDNFADLVTVGNTKDLPSGVWLAPGKNTAQVTTSAGNIGINGNGVVGDNRPANFDGAQVVTGIFTGEGPQDVLVYYPTDTATAGKGSGVVITGNGDGSALQAQLSGTGHTIPANELLERDELDERIPNTEPIQVANAGDSIGNDDNSADLIAIGGLSGNYHLNYYFYASVQNLQGVFPITAKTPAGDMNWNQWRIATAQTPSGVTSTTSMFLWHRTTGALHLWRDLDMSTGDLRFKSYRLAAAGWNTNADVTLQAADVNSDSLPDLWAVGAGQTVTAHVTSNLVPGSGGSNGSGTISAQAPQKLTSAQHNWNLNDIGSASSGDTITTAADNAPTGTIALPLSGSSGAKWKTGDLFSPTAELDGVNGVLHTAGPAVRTNADFSVSAWVKPSVAAGTVLSQDGGNTSGFKLWIDSATRSWRFALSRSDSASATWDTAAAPDDSVQVGVWTHLTATYRQNGGTLTLYVNGAHMKAATHTATWNAAGEFRIGDQRLSGAGNGAYLMGQVAGVQTWNQVIDPAQAQSPASYYQRIAPTRFLNTMNGDGGSTGPIASGSTVPLKIAGTATIPTANVTAVAVNITVVSPTTSGYLTAYPSLTIRPGTSNVNYKGGITIANYAIVPVGADGYINLYLATGSAHLLVDVSGYFTADAAAAGNATYAAVNPARVVDSRSGLGLGSAGKIPAGATRDITVTGGPANIPAGATAIAVNVTATGTTAGGYFVTWEQGKPRPATSGVQYRAGGLTHSTMDIVPVNTSNGKISLYTLREAHAIIDVMGYFTNGTDGQKYHTLNAARLIDTRYGSSPMTATETRHVAPGNTVIADDPTLVLGLTVTEPTTAGFITTHPSGISRPGTPNVNFSAGETLAGTALVNTGAGGGIATYNNSGTTHLLIDCTGYFSNN